MKNLKYKITKENKDNIFDTEIEVSGVTNKFTPRELVISLKSLNKLLIEITANKKIKAATMKNIENSNPIVKDLSPENLCACYLYYEAFTFNKEADKKLKEIETQIETDETNLEEIKKQTGLDINNKEV